MNSEALEQLRLLQKARLFGAHGMLNAAQQETQLANALLEAQRRLDQGQQ